MRIRLLMIGLLVLSACGKGGGKDCKKAPACAGAGACVEKAGKCVAASDADCKASGNCKVNGACGLDSAAGVCVATSEADCAASSACTADRTRESPCLFSPVRKRCVGIACGEDGMCGEMTSYTADEAREKAEGYAAAGGGTTSTTVGTDADCKASTNCANSGNCWVVGEKCGPKTEADCQQSQLCKVAGWCGLTDGRCVATEAGCAASENCKTKGTCTASTNGACE